ncbi:MAG: DUF1993 domain-containing protein [Caulobacteraceae bacterium]
MALSLYDVTVPTFTQILGAMSSVLDKGEAHAVEKGMRPDEWAGARLFSDMAPLSFQVKQAVHHSVGAIEAVKKGVFGPDITPPPETFDDLQAVVRNALEALERYTPAEINALEGRDMRFEFRDRRMDFTGENFLLSFSLPNFYFHATTAYDILRHNGVPLGKRDFMGRLRLKT